MEEGSDNPNNEQDPSPEPESPDGEPKVEATPPPPDPENTEKIEEPATAPPPTPTVTDDSVMAPSPEPLQSSSAPQPSADSPSKADEEKFELELLSEQYENYMRIANALLRTLRLPKDIENCSDLLKKAKRLNASSILEVKRNNNRFLRYCLRVFKYSSENFVNYGRVSNIIDDNMRAFDNSKEVHSWLEENKMYMSMKNLQDGTFVVYAAIADQPNSGWLEGGLSILEKKAACER